MWVSDRGEGGGGGEGEGGWDARLDLTGNKNRYIEHSGLIYQK